MWTEPIASNGSVSSDPPVVTYPSLGLAYLKSTVYLTASSWRWKSNDLWTLNESTGNVLGTKHFDHYVLPPIMSDNEVFVAADLYLIAYT